MASEATRPDPVAPNSPSGAAMQHRHWLRWTHLSRALPGVERFLAQSGFDRGPWLAVAFAAGIVAWFSLGNAWQWLSFIALCLGCTAASSALLRSEGAFPYLRQSLLTLFLLAALGCATVWTKSDLVGARAIERPTVTWITATVLERDEQPARNRTRLVLATREPGSGHPIRIRVNLPEKLDRPEIDAGARIRLRARLMPPAPPMLPGGYDFARTAWFSGLSATGTVIEPVEVVQSAEHSDWIAAMQARLSRHVRAQLPGAEGGIAATLASGHRGAISEEDAQAMRDSGLAHLLSISGLHVSAVIAVAYMVATRLLALWPWLALRVRLPVLAAGAGALAGVAYTLLTGAEVPTVRSCIGALLVLVALALGRDPLSLRMTAVAAFVVMLLWPESLMGPSFQMSFSAVITIVALSGAAPVRKFLSPRQEKWPQRVLRHIGMLFLTGFVIELVLMPIALYHFHRSGLYGAFANVIAIPLTTLISMPLIALALLFDLVGAGAPIWWLAGVSLEVLLGLAHWISSQPGAVHFMPAMSGVSFGLFAIGGLWLALWRGKVRLLGLLPAALGAASLLMLRPPDVLISGDGRHVGISGETPHGLLVLRQSRSSYVRDNLTEMAGMNGEMLLLADWSGAKCSRDFCTVNLHRGGRTWHLLIARSRDKVPERALAAACDRADIVIADRWLPRSCSPRWFKADRRMLSRTGGLAIDLTRGSVLSVADGQGKHGWWRGD